jgi:hypothetical protein
MVQFQFGDQAQPVGLLRLRLHVADRIAEHVVRPAGLGGGRADAELGRDQPQIMAVARADHQPVRGEAHRPHIQILGGVDDANARHRGSACHLRGGLVQMTWNR